MAGRPCTIKVLDHSQASPPPGSVPNTSLPLTFFDIPWLLCCPMQRLFFYEFPCSTLNFTHTLVPSLKTSFSHALQTFYPLAGKLLCPPPPLSPHLLYTVGDFVPFTVAESSADFYQTIGNHARDVQDLHPFVPELPPATVLNNSTRILPILALQVTVFPSSGICVGVTFRHVAADGRSFNHFMKSWASILMAGGNSAACLEKSMPFFDRNAIKEKDPCGLESILLNDWWTWASNWEEDKEPAHISFANKVRATVIIGRGDIERLKNLVLTRGTKERKTGQLRASTFVVTCALVWTCLVKAQELSGSIKHEHDQVCTFGFVADCRNRPELGIPETYLGNCLAICYVKMKRGELLDENGMFEATKSIGKRVWEFENEPFRGAEKWMRDWKEVCETGHLVTVSGSPKLRAYDTDFGWGKPKKTEVVQIDASGAISFGECRDEEGGIEIGLALDRNEMETFNKLFQQV